MKICSYIAAGFRLEGDMLTFATPSTSIGSEFVVLRPDERRQINKELTERDYVSILEGMLQVRWSWPKRETSSRATMRWEICDASKTWMTYVYVEEPQASLLFDLLNWRVRPN